MFWGVTNPHNPEATIPLAEAILTAIQAIKPGKQPPQVALTFATPAPPPTLPPKVTTIVDTATNLGLDFFGALSTLHDENADHWADPDNFKSTPNADFEEKDSEANQQLVTDLTSYIDADKLHPATAYALLQKLADYPHWEAISHNYKGPPQPPPTASTYDPEYNAILINEDNFIDVCLQFARGRGLINGTLNTAFHRAFHHHMFLDKTRKKGFHQRERVQQKSEAQVAPTTRYYSPTQDEYTPPVMTRRPF